MTTNLARLAGWPLKPHEALVCDVVDPTYGMIGGGTQRRKLHFLNMFWRVDLLEARGFEEEFMRGWAYEDSEFVLRWERLGYSFTFSEEQIAAFHQPHPRVEALNVGGTMRNQQLFTKLTASDAGIANAMRDFGSSDFIIDAWVSPRC